MASTWEAARASFGIPSGLAMLAGVALGLGLPAIDARLGIDLPALAFESQSSARSLLETIGTATVAVAGLSFSVSVVAFALASSQLSPRVLRSFGADGLSQATLALLLGTFIYSLTLLVRLGVSGEGSMPPNLSITVAVLLAFTSFVTFAAFIAHIVDMLQPSSVIATIRTDAAGVISARFPAGPGEPDDPAAAAERAETMIDAGDLQTIESVREGYLTLFDTGPIIHAAQSADALVRQCHEIGAYVLPGEPIAELWTSAATDVAELEAKVRDAIQIGNQRTMVQDLALPIRQLTDIALKGLSPGINDPTTATNAMDTLGAVLVEFARSERPAGIRVDGEQVPRLITAAPDLDALVRLGFMQTRVFAGPYPVVSIRLLELLDHLERIAEREGVAAPEIDRQRQLIADGVGEEGPSDADRSAVRSRAQASSPPSG